MTWRISISSQRRPLARLVLAAFLAMGLQACIPGEGLPPIGGPQAPGAVPLAGIERGSIFEPVLLAEDRREMGLTAARLLDSGGGLANSAWTAHATGKSGTVSVGAPFLIGLDSNSGARIAAPSGIDTSVPLAPATGNLRALKNANIRLSPSTEGAVSGTLPAGTVVRAYGQVKPSDWYLVGEVDLILGYVSATLLERVGGGEPLLAGGKAKRPRLCRDLSLTILMPDGRRDAWNTLACQKDDGSWEVPKERGLV